MVAISEISLKQLQNTGMFSGSISSLFRNHEEVARSLNESQGFWENLGQDNYMRDGGTYRKRRFGEAEYDAKADRLDLLEPRPHFQPTSINALNGGVARVFEPTEQAFQRTVLFDAVVRVLGRALSSLEGGCDWRINVHQVRITATGEVQGKPVPEGIHRDGITYGILLLMNRRNVVEGGHTTLFTPDREPLFERTLLNPGDCLVYNDRIFLHDTTALCAAEGKHANRDMFIVEFSSPEDETQLHGIDIDKGAQAS